MLLVQIGYTNNINKNPIIYRGKEFQIDSAFTLVSKSIDENFVIINSGTEEIDSGSYIFLDTMNTRNKIIIFEFMVMRKQFVPHDINEISPLLTGKDKIYSNGGSEIIFQQN